MHSALNSVINYIHGDGLAILPQMELLLFALGILIFDFLLDKKEKYWNAILALTGVAASAFGVFMQVQRYDVLRKDPNGPPGILGFHDTVIVDGFFSSSPFCSSPPPLSSFFFPFVTSNSNASRKANTTR